MKTAWHQWFVENDIEPLPITYDELETKPEDTVEKIFAWIDVPASDAAPVTAPNLRLANELNESFIKRYHDDLKRHWTRLK